MESLQPFVSNYFNDLLITHRITLIMCEPRKTWRGKWTFKGGRHIIYVTKNLPMDQFLVTLGHEIAHAMTYDKYFPMKFMPHGKEWKDTFKTIMEPILCGHLPKEVEDPLKKFMKNPTATTRHSDEITTVKQKTLDMLTIGCMFTLKRNNKVYKVIKKIRVNWLCEDTNTREQWKIRGTSEIF